MARKRKEGRGPIAKKRGEKASSCADECGGMQLSREEQAQSIHEAIFIHLQHLWHFTQ